MCLIINLPIVLIAAQLTAKPIVFRFLLITILLIMPYLVFLTIVFGIFFLTASNASSQPRIINGQPALAPIWRSVGAISTGDPSVYEGQFCAGTLISRRWVLTARHCLPFINKQSTITFRRDLRGRDGRRRAIIAKISHPQFKRSGLHYDLALLALNRPINDYPALAISSRRPAPGQKLKIAGWGITAKKRSSPQLLATTIFVRQQKLCRARFPRFIHNSSFCANSNRGNDSCQGDSGGPALWGRQLVGVTSWGRKCGIRKNPGVYALTAGAKRWIKETIANYPLNKKPRRKVPAEKYYWPFEDRPYVEINPQSSGGYFIHFYLYPRQAVQRAVLKIPEKIVFCPWHQQQSCGSGPFLLGDLRKPADNRGYDLHGTVNEGCFWASWEVIFSRRVFPPEHQKIKICR